MDGQTNEVYNDRSLDQVTPTGVPLTAKYKRSFAYSTIKDRLPIIIAKVVDCICRDKQKIIDQFGEEAAEEIKSLIGSFSKLRNELQTNKPLLPILVGDEANIWNGCIENARWFDSPWLLVECYLYRRMRDNILQCPSLTLFDQFLEQKQDGLIASMPAMKGLESHLNNITATMETNAEGVKEDLLQIFKVSLWGNKCDMSLSAGEQRQQVVDPIRQLPTLEEKILDNHLEQVWEKILKLDPSSSVIDIILDNAGFELFTDLCLADFLITQNLAQTVRFHAKNMPWFVSDATPLDIFWSLEQLEQRMPDLGSRWSGHFHSGRWILHPREKSSFWTLPFAFGKMKEIDPALYDLLNSSGLVIFKGDLNYRKLVGDLNWHPGTDVRTAFEGCPTPLLTLRTLKADVVVGLNESIVSKMEGDWMVNGEFAVIQFLDK